MKPGRPTKYSPSYPDELVEHMAQGRSFASFGGIIGVTRETLYEWTRVYPAFSDALKIGRAKGMSLWEDRLATQATASGGNTAAIIFALKNLYQDDWSDRNQTELTGANGGPIETKDVSARERIARRLASLASREPTSEDSGGADGE